MFTDWIKYIIFVVLFASFLELILPSSSMQRFVRVIMGLFIMLAILNPIISVVQQYLVSPKQITALSTNSGNSISMINEVNGTVSEREKLSLELYKKELSQQMRIMIMAIDGVAEANVAIDINTINKSNVNAINSVVVYIKPGISTQTTKVAAIEKISIGEGNEKAEELHTDLKKRIVDMITELYQIPNNKIEIRMLHS